MISPVSLTIDEQLYQRLSAHLFPGDSDEHGAVIAAGIAQTARGTRLLARELFLATDGIDYVPGQQGYRALTPQFIATTSDYCAREGLCYLAVHCHGGSDRVGFSSVDLASQRRGYGALLDITSGGPVGALVFAPNAIAGNIWTRGECVPLSSATVLGTRIWRLYPEPLGRPRHADPMYDRHARLFGDLGQEILGNLKVGIIGLGGGGSLLNEWLARLGIGHIIAIDFDYVDLTNVPRIVGATERDALAWLARSRHTWLQRLALRFARRKVHVAERVARQATPRIRYDAVVGDIRDEATARLLADVDFLFLASDSMQSRLIFNMLIHQYLIPGAQVGAKVRTDPMSRKVGDIHTATRLVLPAFGQGCLWCNGYISPERLQEEALTPGERRAQRYIDDPAVAEPSVITLNALSAGQAANDLLFMFTGLFHDNVVVEHHLNLVRERSLNVVMPRADASCLHCGSSAKSHRARGDRARLPCRTAA